MEKTIKIDKDKSLKLSNNLAWMMIYREQFGRDIVPVLMPALNSGVSLAYGMLQQMDGKLSIENIKKIDFETIEEAVFQLSGIEMVDLLNVIWAMAKTADDEIEEPKIWIREFDTFPLDTILPAAVDLVAKGTINSKNLKRLQNLRQSLEPSALTESSSVDNGED